VYVPIASYRGRKEAEIAIGISHRAVVVDRHSDDIQQSMFQHPVVKMSYNAKDEEKVQPYEQGN
jgi:hypothetical protein